MSVPIMCYAASFSWEKRQDNRAWKHLDSRVVLLGLSSWLHDLRFVNLDELLIFSMPQFPVHKDENTSGYFLGVNELIYVNYLKYAT